MVKTEVFFLGIHKDNNEEKEVGDKTIKTAKISETSNTTKPSDPFSENSLNASADSNTPDTLVITDPHLMNQLNEDEIHKVRITLISGEKTFEDLKRETGFKEDRLKSLLFTLLSKNVIFFEEKKKPDEETVNLFYKLKAKNIIYQQREKQIFTNPTIMTHLGHEKKRQLLHFMHEKGRTIMELSKLINMNPGTVKRHLSDLIQAHLITIEKEEFNERRILLKYYIAVAKKIVFHYEWPSSDYNGN